MIALDVMVEAGDWDRLDDSEALDHWEVLAQRAAEAATLAANRAAEDLEVSVMLTDDAHIRELNKAWRGKDKPTNVLSFPAPAQPGAASAATQPLAIWAILH